MRLEGHKPTQVPLDSTLSFGASTRTYTLRERPTVVLPLIGIEEDEEGMEGGTLLGLPELDNDLDVSVFSEYARPIKLAIFSLYQELH